MTEPDHVEAGPVALHRAEGLLLFLETPKGRGIFAAQCIPKGTVIEVCPVLVLEPGEVNQHTSKTILNHYTYNWPAKDGSSSQAIVLGLGSMFNHSTYSQNVAWRRDLKTQCVTYTALKDIAPKEELCISYGRLWFKDADADAIDQAAEEEDLDGLGGLARIATS